MAKKYIDAEKLKAEIEKRLKNVRDYMNGARMKYKGPKYFKAQGKESSYDALLSIIDSLQQEQPEVELEKEITRFLASEESTTYENAGSYKVAIKDPKKIARHFYELGLNARKEE